ncbi:hypothetical protein DOY81_001875 [Sarcophaga bullata]|nr:hypothetical protein DOY81_001875 [Sarcophaga bullata]
MQFPKALKRRKKQQKRIFYQLLTDKKQKNIKQPKQTCQLLGY